MSNAGSPPLLKVRAAWRRWLFAALLAATGAAAVWWFWYVPRQVEHLYGEAVEEYRAGNYAQAIARLERAYALNPRAVRVNILLGWSHWRRGEATQAASYFARAHRLEPSSEEAQMGLAFASLAIDEVAVALPLFQELAKIHPGDKEIQFALAEAYSKSGRNLSAAQIYRAILERTPADADAQRALLALYGYPDYSPERPLTFFPKPRPFEQQQSFRLRGSYFQALEGRQWKTVYIVGVNLGPARPGEFPSTASREFSPYFEWLKQIAAMNANTVRVYTLLPPAFYQALKAYNEKSPAPLWLIQEIWLDEELSNLYDPATKRAFEQQISTTTDVLHGQADVGCHRGRSCGIYTADVSSYVLALALGREIEPSVVQTTNRQNPAHSSYKGRYVSVEKGNPSEVWFAEMCDLAVRYEIEQYNAQRPLTVVNWPPLDPMTHPTEATYEEELRIRRHLGEQVPEEVPPEINDMDVVSLDITKFNVEPEFNAGLFSLYHVYQHWPDFLLHEPSYAQARDSLGPNRYLGYLQELKKAHGSFPLLIGEYGASTSLGVAHLHPQGWNNGGLTQKQQAELLVRFTKNIRETGCAGGLVFEWQDEWFKHVHDQFTADFERPWDRDPLWLNVLDPEENFGIVSYEPDVSIPLLRGEVTDWQGAQQLYPAAPGEPEATVPPPLRAVHATSDFAYLYLRLDLQRGQGINWKEWNYWIALTTLPGESGSHWLPEIGVRLDSGANFLIQLSGPDSGRILIAENYNPNQPVPVAGRPGESRIGRKQSMKIELRESVPFEEILTEANPPRYARDGGIFPALNFNRSPLAYSIAHRERPGFSSHALWSADLRKGMIELRIPWGLLLIMDPSNLQVFGGTDEKWMPASRPTRGIGVAVIALRLTRGNQTQSQVVASSFPPTRNNQRVGPLAVYTWAQWNQVRYRPHFKTSYFALQKVLAELTKEPLRSPAR